MLQYFPKLYTNIPFTILKFNSLKHHQCSTLKNIWNSEKQASETDNTCKQTVYAIPLDVRKAWLSFDIVP